MKLPTEPEMPSYDMKKLKLLLYGQPKIGKSTFASNAEGALFLECEPGLEFLKRYAVPINGWKDITSAGQQLATEREASVKAGKPYRFQTVVFDTIDLAFKHCQRYIMEKFKIQDPSDLGYGKGHNLVNNELHRVITSYAMAGFGVYMLSHATTEEVEARNGSKFTRIVPTLSKGARRICCGFADVIAYAEVDHYQKEGEEKSERMHVIKFKPSTLYDAGDRTKRLPNMLPLDYTLFREALETGKYVDKASGRA